MKVLIACEFSGVVRDAFLAEGYNAISCDLQPTEVPGPHIQGDVLNILDSQWDLVIAHPPCTYLANSGVRWRVEREEWDKVAEAAWFFDRCLKANAPYVAVENPVMARKYTGIRKADFSIQPWQFGDNYKKRTQFWTKGLPKLTPTSDLDGSTAIAECHLAPPSATRQNDRSRTYKGIAEAMAKQWGSFVSSKLGE